MRTVKTTNNRIDKTILSFPRPVQERLLTAIDIINQDDGRPYEITPKPLTNLRKNVSGVYELRINGSPAYRIIYTIKNNVMYILHAFKKTTNGVDLKAMNLAVERYKDIDL